MHRRIWVGQLSGLRGLLLEGVMLGGALTAVVQTAGLDEAAACSPPPTGFYFDVPAFYTPIPKDGVVFIENTCGPSDCFPLSEATFTVFDEAGSVIEGSLLETPASPSLMMWRPKTPFAPGNYTVEGRHPEADSGLTHPFEVRDALDVPLIEPTRSASSSEVLIASYVCCQEGLEDSCGDTLCYPIVEGVAPSVSVAFDFAHSVDVAPQAFVYRARAKGAQWPSFTSWHQVGARFDEVADEYCYEIQVQDLRTDGELWEQEGCLPASLVPPIIKEDLAEIDRTLFWDCTVPPAGYEARWCETFADDVAAGSCEDHLRKPACEAALVNCPHILAGTSGTGVNDDDVNVADASSAGDDGSVATNEETTGGQDATEPSPDGVRKNDSVMKSSSCNYGARNPSSRLAWALAGLGVVAVASRRRRSSVRAK